MIERQLPLQSSNRWFEKRRDFFTRQLIEDFLAVKQAFLDTYLVYLECRSPGTLDCTDLLDELAVEKRRQLWDRLVRMVGTESEKGPLWQLKDLCHMVWPDIDSEKDASGTLIDWLVGSIFHETMKLKENIYLLDRYGPVACKLKARPLDMVPPFKNVVFSYPVHHLANIIDVQSLITRAAADAVNQMEQIAFLFNHASYMLRLKMSAFAQNSLVVRLLIEQEQKVRQIWGEEIEDILQDLFSGDAAEGFCVAGRSYLSAQWFSQALDMYHRALALDPDCDEVITKSVQLKNVLKIKREPVVV